MSWVTNWLKDSVTITPRGTLSGDGTYTYDGTAVVTVGRVLQKSGRMLDNDGRDFMYKYEVWLKPTESLHVGDHITFGSDVLEVVDIYRGDFIDGTASHIKARCG